VRSNATPVPSATVTVYLALGSNLGDRRALLEAAWHHLVGDLGADRGGGAAALAEAARSPIYETDAVAADSQPPYLNVVVRGRTALPALALLGRCLAIEAALGRVRPSGAVKAARTIDIDILLYGSSVLRTETLVVPHPALLERAFVRVPLADVAEPGLLHPITGTPLDRAPAADAGVRPVRDEVV
jgi:2-amino-4-hydroxy-6-hydroxymethyldihydropteridine diphosphokinase